jgi:serine/threonine protein kinase
MPPEQVTGSRAADARGDVYSLGAILYEILAGRPAFSAPTRLATLLQVLEREPVSPRRWNPGVPRALQAICLRALEKAPDRRPASAAALADELEAFLRGERGPAVGGNLGHRIVRAVRRHPAAGFRLVGIVGTAAVVVVRCLLVPARD